MRRPVLANRLFLRLADPRTRHAGKRSSATTRSRRTWSCRTVAHRLAGATQASPRLVHTTPAPTRWAGAHRFFKQSHHQPTLEGESREGTLAGQCVALPENTNHRLDSCLLCGCLLRDCLLGCAIILIDGLQVNFDIHILTHQNTACFEPHIPVEAPIFAINPRFGAQARYL